MKSQSTKSHHYNYNPVGGSSLVYPADAVVKDMTRVLQHAETAVMWELLPGRNPVPSFLSIPDLAKMFKQECFNGSFSEYLQIKITNEIRNKIFTET